MLGPLQPLGASGAGAPASGAPASMGKLPPVPAGGTGSGRGVTVGVEGAPPLAPPAEPLVGTSAVDGGAGSVGSGGGVTAGVDVVAPPVFVAGGSPAGAVAPGVVGALLDTPSPPPEPSGLVLGAVALSVTS